MATALSARGRLKPCHSASSNAGAGAPSTTAATAATSGPAMAIGARPTATQIATNTITGAFIPSGGSCG